MSASSQRVLYVLTGCTAAGKTEWALRWAETYGAEIISCDSLLFYRGLDIGTAKPTPAEQARVPHHLIDICDVTERMDVTCYVELARAAAERIAARGQRVLVTGGSGFYLKAFFAPVADAVAVPPAVRARVAELDLSAALAALRRLNPEGLGPLDTANPRRVSRALERCLASGRPLAQLTAEFARQPAPFADWRVALTRLDRPPAEMETRIAGRVQTMLAAGLVDEVQRWLPAGLKENPSAAKAIGYRETIAMLEGALPAEALAAEIVKSTRALVKKQRTWFRTQLPPHRVVVADATAVETLFAGAPAPRG